MELLHSNIIGKGEKKLIILHGFLGMGDNWKTHAKNLAEKGYCVHLIDQRNHGRSFWSDNFSYQFMVEDLKTYTDHHQIASAILLGHSMGGKTAMNFALKYSQLVEKLIIADISPKYYAPHHQNILAGLASLDFQVIRSRKGAEEQLSNYISDFRIRQFLLKNLHWLNNGKLGLRINIGVLKNSGEAIGQAVHCDKVFDKPTLFMIGSNSNYIDKSIDNRMITSYFLKTEMIEIKGAGHWLHSEQPKLFFDHLISWIG
jgi:pimeloyl-ACP methyl ester carboxylesterase